MKRALVFLIIVTFLSQAFAGLEIRGEKRMEKETSIEAMPTEYFPRGAEQLTRGTVNESDALGGSWFDDFDDENGIEWKENASVAGGKVRMGDNEVFPDRNCTALWHFNNGSGDIAFDASGNGNNGAIHGAKWGYGKFGKALEFDGVDDYVSFPTLNGGNVFTAYTCELWFKTDTTSGDHRIIDARSGHGYFYIRIFNNALYGWQQKVDGNYVEVTIPFNDVNHWHYVVMSWDGNDLKLYLDGELADSDIITDMKNDSHLGNCIGSNEAHTDYFLKGIIDELAIYNRSLAPWEVAERAKRYRNSSYIASTPINLPADNHWDVLSVDKIEPEGTFINISLIDNATNSTILGFDNLTGRNIDLGILDEMGATSVRLRAWFEGDGNATPILGSWGMEWRGNNAWRDSFTGDAKSIFSNGSMGTYRNGSAQLGYYERVAGLNTSALWHFSEGEGGEVNDSSGNGNDGIIHGANWTNGSMGKGLEFDGVDDHVLVGASTSLDFSMADNFSAEMWIKINSAVDHCLLLKRFTGNGQLHWNFSIFSDGSLFFGLDKFTTGGWSEHTTPSGLIATDEWYHVAFTKRGQNPGNVSLYIDGLEVLSETIGPNPQGATAAGGPIYMGKHFDHGQYFNGTIDEVAIYNRSLTASEIYDHSQRYHTNATLLSEPISLPQYHSWDKLVINKTEPRNHFINVSIIDNATNETIQNFDQLNDSGVIDISSIDFLNNTTIRLKAAFEGNGSNTSLLHSWGLNWTNHLPVLGAPTYVNSVNRTETVNISIPARDNEENNSTLVFEREYKLHSSGLWTINYISDVHFSSDHYFLNFTPPSDAPVGSYDLRFRLTDTPGATNGWQYYNNSIEVMNNQLAHDGINLSAYEVYRTDSVNITVLNITDVETVFANMIKTVQYRLNGTEEWNDTYISVARRGENATFVLTPDASASLGRYDLRVLLNDSDDELENIYPNLVLVNNNLPTILTGLENVSLEVNSSMEINLTSYGDDLEDGIEELNWSYNISSVDVAYIGDISIINGTLNFTAIKGGLTSIDLVLMDTDGGSASREISINISELPVPETGELGGYVVDVDGEGIHGAAVVVGTYTWGIETQNVSGNLTNVSVQVPDIGQPASVADSNGSFLIEGIRPGKWNVTVTATGYIDHTEERVFTKDLLKKNFTLTTPPLETYEVFVGPVLDGDGDPVMGAAVSFSLNLTGAMKPYDEITNTSGFAKFTLPVDSIPPGTVITAIKDGITIIWAQGEVIPRIEVEVTGFEIPLGPFLTLNKTPLAGVEVIVVHNNVTFNGTTDAQGNVILKNFPNSTLHNGTKITAKYDNNTYEYVWNSVTPPIFIVGEEIKAPSEEEETDNTLLYVIIAVIVIIIIGAVIFIVAKRKKKEETPAAEGPAAEGGESPAGTPPVAEPGVSLQEPAPGMAVPGMMAAPPMPESMVPLPPPAEPPLMEDMVELGPPSDEELELLDEEDYDELFEEVPFEEVEAFELDEYFDEALFEEVFEEVYGGEFVEEGFDY